MVKGDGGAVGLTENPSALKRWMLCGPEMARLVSEFEGSSEVLSKGSQDKRHEQKKGSQTLFVTEVSALKTVIAEMGNLIHMSKIDWNLTPLALKSQSRGTISHSLEKANEK